MNTRTHVEYAVEAKTDERDWHVVSPWYPDNARFENGMPGFIEAENFMAWVMSDPVYIGMRVVKRTTITELMDLTTEDVVRPWPACADHKEVQHRDGRSPWCNTCGWNRGANALPPSKVGSQRTTTTNGGLITPGNGLP